MADLTEKSVTFTLGGASEDTTIGGFYTETVGQVASLGQQAQDNSTIQDTLASNAQTRRESVSGVSTDEELIAVIQHQHAYQAAARLVQVVSDMTQTLVDLGR